MQKNTKRYYCTVCDSVIIELADGGHICACCLDIEDIATTFVNPEEGLASWIPVDVSIVDRG